MMREWLLKNDCKQEKKLLPEAIRQKKNKIGCFNPFYSSQDQLLQLFLAAAWKLNIFIPLLEKLPL